MTVSSGNYGVYSINWSGINIIVYGNVRGFAGTSDQDGFLCNYSRSIL